MQEHRTRNASTSVRTSTSAEYHGHSEFWPYANAGYHAAGKGNYAEAQKMYLRAYRNTGVLLLSTPPPAKEPPTLGRAFFGMIPELLELGDAQQYVEQLDTLTPLPGQNLIPDEVLNHITNYWRSLASYNWALYAARLGQFAEAEVAFRYSLELEKIRDPRNEEQVRPSRHFELARLYRVWGRTESSIKEFRLGFQTVSPQIRRIDPIGFAYVLDEYADVLKLAGQVEQSS
ncbi:MAG: hypothetical protein ACK4UN_09855, partial [Limisphaerales bacterium]